MDEFVMSNEERTVSESSGAIELADNFVVIQPNKPKSPIRWILPLSIIVLIAIGLWYSYQLSRPLIRVIIDSKQIISEKALLDMPSFVDNDTVAFSRDGDSGGVVISFKQLNPSGKQFFTKSYSKVEYLHPVMSLNVSEVLLMFTIKQYNTPRIYSLPLNGTPREIAYGEWASSSKDGKNIVFQRISQRYNNEKPEIWIMNTDGSDQKSTNLKGRHPECSAKRDQLAFEGNNSSISSIQITKIENPEQNLKILTKKDNCLYPSFSPDGKLILFYKKGDGLWVMKNNGSRQQRIIKASKSSEIMMGRISPDGKRLVVWSGTKNEGKLSIYKIKYRNIRPSKQKIDVSSLAELIDSIKLSDKNDSSVTENQAQARPDVNVSEPENNKSFAYVNVKNLTPKDGIIMYIDNNKVATTPIDNPIAVEPGLHKIRLENPKSGATWEGEYSFQNEETYKLPKIDLR
jgi:Tol biopolymer transport system component